MRMWCPHCGAEYVEGWGTCSTCGVTLVSEQPAHARPDDEAWGRPTSRETEAWDPQAVRDHEDPFVPVWEGPTPQANELLRKIEARHIPVELDDALEVGHARVQVPRSYIEEARDVVLGRLPVRAEKPLDDEDFGFDWGPIVRVAIVVTAVLLIVALLLAQ